MFLVSLGPVTPAFFGVGEKPDLMMLTWSMSFKVEIPQSMKNNEMNDTEDVCEKQSGDDTRFM